MVAWTLLAKFSAARTKSLAICNLLRLTEKHNLERLHQYTPVSNVVIRVCVVLTFEYIFRHCLIIYHTDDLHSVYITNHNTMA